MMNCPKCDAELSFEEADPSVGIGCGGWYCEACDLFTSEHEVDREPMPGDVEAASLISRTIRKILIHRDKTKPLGTPLSELSGQPGHKGYAEFKRIAKSWGYD